MITFRAAWSKLAIFLGISYLSKNFLRFAKMHSFFGLALNLSGVFIGTFLLKAGGGFAVVGVYYLCCYGFEAIGNLWIPWLTKRFAPTTISRFGIILQTVSYIILLALQTNVIHIFPLVAILGALGASCYWVPYHDYSVRYTSPDNRQIGMSLLGLLWNLIVLIAPMISGTITSRLAGMNGYSVIFAISVTSFVCAIITIRKLPSEPSGGTGNPLFRIICEDLKKLPMLFMSLAHFFYGMREGIYMYYLNIVIFDMISSEFVLGINITARSIIAIFTFFVMGRVLNPKRRVSGCIIMLVLSLLFSIILRCWYYAPIVMMVYILDAVLTTFINNSLQFCAYDTVDFLGKKGENRRTDVISLRNCVLNVGRVIGILFLLLSPLDDNYVIIILNSIAILSGFFIWGARRAVDGCCDE